METKLEQPDIRPISDTHYRLEQDYEYTWFWRQHYNALKIPAGFVADGASVPRIAWTLSGLRPDGLLRAAALLHDAHYRYKGRLPEGWHTYIEYDEWQPVMTEWRRKEADQLFLQVMKQAGMKAWRAKMAYYAVRSFGWMAW